jgi:hypothetical protein
MVQNFEVMSINCMWTKPYLRTYSQKGGSRRRRRHHHHHHHHHRDMFTTASNKRTDSPRT